MTPQILDKVMDSNHHIRMDTPNTEPAEAVFEHASGVDYSHLWREVILSYRKLMRQVAWHTQFTGAQFEILRQLAVDDGVSTVSALARDLALDPAAVTRICADLVSLGVVERQSDANDGRKRPVALTEEGRRQMAFLHSQLHERESALAGEGLDTQAIETTIRVLRAMRAGADDIPLRP